MVADGHAQLVVAVGTGLHQLAVHRLRLAVHLNHNALGGNIRAGVIDIALHGERRHILEVNIIGRQAGGADVHRARGGRETVYAQFRGHLIVGAALLEGYTFYYIVALLVGHAVEFQQTGHLLARRGVGAHLGVVQLVEAALAGDVEGVLTHQFALVQGPVEREAVLGAAQDAGVTAGEFAVVQCAGPEADVIDMALVEGVHGLVASADGQRRGALGGDGLPVGVGHGDAVRQQRVGAYVELPLPGAVIHGGDVGEVVLTEGQAGELRHAVLRSVAARQIDGVEAVVSVGSARRLLALRHAGDVHGLVHQFLHLLLGYQLKFRQLHDVVAGALIGADFKAEVLIGTLLVGAEGVGFLVLALQHIVVSDGGYRLPFAVLIQLGFQHPALGVTVGVSIGVVAGGQRVALHIDRLRRVELAVVHVVRLNRRTPFGVDAAVHQFGVALIHVVLCATVGSKRTDSFFLRTIFVFHFLDNGLIRSLAAYSLHAHLQRTVQRGQGHLVAAFAGGLGPQLQRGGLAAAEQFVVLRRVGLPHKALAGTLDVARQVLHLVALLVGGRLHEVHPYALHRRAGAVGDVARDGAASLREAGGDEAVHLGLLHLLGAHRAVGLHGVLIVCAGLRPRVGPLVVLLRVADAVRHRGPLLRAHGAALHQVFYLVRRVGVLHVPFHLHHALLRARGGGHVLDVAARGEARHQRVAVHVLTAYARLDAVGHGFAHRAAEVGCGLRLVHVHGDGLRALQPRRAARRLILYVPRQALGGDAVLPLQAHLLGVVSVLRQRDVYAQGGAHRRLLPQVVVGVAAGVARQLVHLRAVGRLKDGGQEDHAVGVLPVVVDVGVGQFQFRLVAVHGAYLLIRAHALLLLVAQHVPLALVAAVHVHHLPAVEALGARLPRPLHQRLLVPLVKIRRYRYGPRKGFYQHALHHRLGYHVTVGHNIAVLVQSHVGVVVHIHRHGIGRVGVLRLRRQLPVAERYIHLAVPHVRVRHVVHAGGVAVAFVALLAVLVVVQIDHIALRADLAVVPLVGHARSLEGQFAVSAPLNGGLRHRLVGSDAGEVEVLLILYLGRGCIVTRVGDRNKLFHDDALHSVLESPTRWCVEYGEIRIAVNLARGYSTPSVVGGAIGYCGCLSPFLSPRGNLMTHIVGGDHIDFTIECKIFNKCFL